MRMFPFEDEQALAVRNANVSFFLFIAGCFAGLFKMMFTPVPFGRGWEMYNIAANLATHGTYANPFASLDTGVTAANPPLYPFLLAVLMRLVPGYVFPIAAALGTVVANAVVAAWLPRFSQLAFGHIRPGLFAACLWLVCEQLRPDWDVNYTVVLLMLFCFFTFATLALGRPLRWGAAAGLIAGALFLLNPAVLLVFAPWTAVLPWFRRVSLAHLARYYACAMCIFVLLGGGWMLRNRVALGAFVVRSNFGMILYASNNDCASASAYDSNLAGCLTTYYPDWGLNEARLVRSLGEVAYDRLRARDARLWMAAHPAAFARLTALRLCDFWLPIEPNHAFGATVIWLASLLSLPGLALAVRRAPLFGFFALAVFLLFPPLYYVIATDTRYRLPILWISFLLAGYAAHLFAERHWVRRWMGHGRFRGRKDALRTEVHTPRSGVVAG